MVTTDLSDFGYEELDLACDLLQAMKNGLPNDFYDEDITIAFNSNSGEVFLTNSQYESAIDVNGYLYSWYNSPISDAYEGTVLDLYEMFKMGEIDDIEELKWLANIFETSDDAEEGWADEVREAME